MLRKEVEAWRACSPVTRAIVLAAAGGLLIAWLRPARPAAPEAPPPSIITIPIPSLIPVPAPVAAPVPAAPPAPVLAALDAEPGVPLDSIPELRNPPAHEPWLGVAASLERPEIVVAWTAKEARASRDDGRSFALIDLDGVDSAAIDARGRVYLAHQTGVRVEDEDGRVAWHDAVLGAVPRWFGAAGERVAWIGHDEPEDPDATLVVTGDGGATWERRELPSWGNYRNDVHVDPGGRVYLMTGSEAQCGGGAQSRFAGHLDGRAWRDLAWPLDAPVSWELGAGGWAYDLDCDAEHAPGGVGQCAIDARGRVHALRGGRALSADHTTFVARSRGATFFMQHPRLWRAREDRVALVARDVPPALAMLVADGEDRVLAVASGSVMRWSERSGWRVLLTAPAP